MAAPEVRIRSWVRSGPDDERAGLLGYLSIFYGDLVLDGLTVRKTSDGRIGLGFPARTDRVRRRHPTVRPTDDAARQQIEREVLKALAPHLAEILG
jgi:hypothetical protein